MRCPDSVDLAFDDALRRERARLAALTNVVRLLGAGLWLAFLLIWGQNDRAWMTKVPVLWGYFGAAVVIAAGARWLRAHDRISAWLLVIIDVPLVTWIQLGAVWAARTSPEHQLVIATFSIAIYIVIILFTMASLDVRAVILAAAEIVVATVAQGHLVSHHDLTRLPFQLLTELLAAGGAVYLMVRIRRLVVKVAGSRARATRWGVTSRRPWRSGWWRAARPPRASCGRSPCSSRTCGTSPDFPSSSSRRAWWRCSTSTSAGWWR